MTASQKLPTPVYEYHATLERVVDGDTVYLSVDLGFRIFASVEFRLARINAPEMKGESRAAGAAAMRYLESLLTATKILVRSDKSRDKYGRWIGDLYIDDGGHYVSVSEAMLDGGHAVPYAAR